MTKYLAWDEEYNEITNFKTKEELEKWLCDQHSLEDITAYEVKPLRINKKVTVEVASE